MAILGQGKTLSSSPGVRTTNRCSTTCDPVRFPALLLPPYQLCCPAPTESGKGVRGGEGALGGLPGDPGSCLLCHWPDGCLWASAWGRLAITGLLTSADAVGSTGSPPGVGPWSCQRPWPKELTAMPLPPAPSRPFIHSTRKPGASGTWAPGSTLQLTLCDLKPNLPEPHTARPGPGWTWAQAGLSAAGSPQGWTAEGWRRAGLGCSRD